MKEPRAGSVRLAPTAFVAPGAVVLGEVTIGHRASVWFNTVVRGDVDTIEVGEASNLQDNSTVHVDEGSPCRIGARVTVGHRSIVHGCVIEDDCLIGMGSVLLSGCRIGTGSYIGAASLVLEGTRIPPGSVALGSPARVVGEVGERHREGIQHGSETYAELAAACMRRGMARHVGRDGELTRDRPAASGAAWRRVLDDLLEMADRVARDVPDDGRAFALATAGRAIDEQARRPVLEALGRGEAVTLREEPSPHPERAANVAGAIASWREERARLVSLLRALNAPEGSLIGHPTRGPFTVLDLACDWLEEDWKRLIEASRA
jgi:carbonic anhydrase/acetyltransferase-like protein (isoleucine patch superfamily)